MSGERDSDERYTERELSLILKRAAELDGGEPSKSLARYTLAEIQEIAAGAGIDRTTVLAAADELRRPTQSTPWLLGGPTRFRADRNSPGVVPSNAFADLVETIRLETGLQGDGSQVFDGLEWRGRDFSGHVFVTVSPRERDTRVTVTAARADEAFLAAMAGGGAAIATIGISLPLLTSLGVPPFAVAAITAVAAGTAFVGTTRALWRRRAERWTRRTSEIAGALTRRIAQLGATTDPSE